jgi:hypothetical protein
MARTVEEWSALLGSTLSKMALVYGTDSPDAYLPEDCYPVIEKMFQAVIDQARAEGHAAAIADIQQGAVRRTEPTGGSTLRRPEASGGSTLRRMIRAVPMARRFA